MPATPKRLRFAPIETHSLSQRVLARHARRYAAHRLIAASFLAAAFPICATGNSAEAMTPPLPPIRPPEFQITPPAVATIPDNSQTAGNQAEADRPGVTKAVAMTDKGTGDEQAIVSRPSLPFAAPSPNPTSLAAVASQPESPENISAGNLIVDATRVATRVPQKLPKLPTASRARMHECGLQWDQMKLSGAAANKTWRVFATACLSQ